MAGHWRINRNRFLQVIRAFRATVLRCSVMSDSLQPRGLLPARLLYPRNSPGKKIGVGCHFLLQGIFPTQGLNPCPLHLRHWQVDFLPLHHLRMVPKAGAGLRLKRLSPMRETWVQSLGREDPLEKEKVTHSSILAWRIPWTEEPGRQQSTGLQRLGHD